MNINLDEEQLKEVKIAFDRLKKIYEDKADFEVLKKERENTLKDEFASVCDVRDKDGNIDGSKIKMPLVMVLLNELFRDKNNPKEEEYAIMEEYRMALSGDKIDEKLIDGYLYCIDEINAVRSYVKDVFNDVSLLDNDTCKAIEELAKEHYKEIYQSKMMEAGFSKEKVEKDTTEYDELKENLEAILMPS